MMFARGRDRPVPLAEEGADWVKVTICRRILGPELMREDLRRYPRSKIGEISNRIGAEVSRSRLKRSLVQFVRSGVATMEGQRGGALYSLLEKP